MTLKRVVLPAPFGPRIARRSPGGDLEVDLADGVEAAEPPADPPQAEGRLGVLGVLVLRSSAYLRIWFVILPFLTTLILPCHGVFTFLHGGCVRPGRRARRLEEAAERLIDVGHVGDDLRANRPVGLLDELELVLVLDRLAAGVERDVRRRSRPGTRTSIDRGSAACELRPDGAAGLRAGPGSSAQAAM